MLESSRMEDLMKALSLVYAIFHMDLEHITLSLLFHTLPRLLQTTHYHTLLTDPRGSTLAKLSVMVLVSAQNSKNSEKGQFDNSTTYMLLCRTNLYKCLTQKYIDIEHLLLESVLRL